MLAAFVWSVVDPAVVEHLGDEEFALGGAGTGPWQFSDFGPLDATGHEAESNYLGGNSPSLSELTWLFLTGPDAASTALDMYKQGEVISADVPLSLLETVSGDSTLSSQLVKISPQGSVRAIGMDFAQPPFDDVRVRRAIALSIDHDNWANQIWEGTWAPGTSFVRRCSPRLPITPPQGIGFKPENAKELLAMRLCRWPGLANDHVFPARGRLRFRQGAGCRAAGHVKQNSGIDIVHDTSLTMQEIVDQTADNGGSQFDIVWWWNIYDTPHLLAVAALPDAPAMAGVFNWTTDLAQTGEYTPGADADRFVQLVTGADRNQDEEARNKDYRKAEQLMLRNAVYIPLGYWIQMYVQDPKLQGTRQGPWTGRLPVLFDKDVVLTSA